MFLKNKNIIFKIRRSKVTDYAALREVPILKRDVTVENHCLIQLSRFDVRIFFDVLAMPLLPKNFFL